MAESRAALQGLKLKEYVAAALRQFPLEDPPAGELGEPGVGYGAEVSVLREDWCLAAFARAGGLCLVTFDRGFRRFPDPQLTLLE